MTMFNHQLAAGAALPQACYPGPTVSGSARNFTRYLTRRVQAALVQHPQSFVQHVEVTFSDDTEFHLLFDVDYLQRFRQRLNTRISQSLAATGLGVKAELRCEWFSASGHHQRPNLHLLTFLGQKTFYLLGDEREPSRTVLNRHIAAAWAGIQELSGECDGHPKSQGGFYLSDRVGDSGVAALLEAMCNVAECSIST